MHEGMTHGVLRVRERGHHQRAVASKEAGCEVTHPGCVSCAQGAMDASNLLKPMLGRGELRCIGATTLDEYRKYIEKDPALERRFQQVYVGQPSVVDTIAILRGLKDRCAILTTWWAVRGGPSRMDWRQGPYKQLPLVSSMHHSAVQTLSVGPGAGAL